MFPWIRPRHAGLALALVVAGCGGGARVPSPVVLVAPHAEAPEEERWSDSESVNEQGDAAVVPLTPALAGALDLYQRGDHLGALLALDEAIAGLPEGSPTAQMAWFFVGKSLARGGFELASLTVFDAISRDAAHAFRARALPWAGNLSFALADPSWPARIAGRYGTRKLGEIGASQPPAVRAQLAYLMGRDSFAGGALVDAIERFGRVPPKARSYLKARFFEGVSWARQQKAGAAARSFQAILDATERSASEGASDEVKRARDLAWLALARLDYAQGTEEAPAPLLRALSEYNRVSPYADQKDEVRLELSWTRLRLREDRAALADFEALPATFLEERAEAYDVKAAAHMYQCELDLAREAVVTAGDIVARRVTELTALTQGASDQALFALAEQARKGSLGTAPMGGALVVAAVKERELGGMFGVMEAIDAERAKITSAPRRLGASALGARLLEDLKAERDRVSARIGEAIRGRAERAIKSDREEGDRVETLKRDIEMYRSGVTPCVPRKLRGKP